VKESTQVADEAQSGQSSSQGGTQQAQDGGSQSANTSQANQANGQSGQTSQQGQTQQTSQQAQTDRPTWLPESFKAPEELVAKFNEYAVRVAADDSRKLSLPQKAEEYKVELPADFKAPEGIKYEFRADDPLLAQARTIAHELGIPQDGFSKLLGLYAGSQVATAQQVTAAKNAEIAKLGPTGTARVDALDTFFKSYLSEAEGKQLMSRAFTASDVQILEKIVAKVTSQGGATFKGNGREPPPAPGRVSDEQYAKMTHAQRLDYARTFDQKQFTNGRAA
jgi:hypothetical protein